LKMTDEMKSVAVGDVEEEVKQAIEIDKKY
jgi:hypothetical protein